jgi:predicted HD superfamily hydrolase involved in NAD metabolism
MGLEQDLLSDGPGFLSRRRWDHCLRTADYAVFMAHHFSIDPEKVRLSALAHDLAREQRAETILEWALLDQDELSPFHFSHPVLLHGFASAWYLRKHYGQDDPSILNAVRYHTTGHPVLDGPGLIVFAADYMEPGRSHLTDLERDELLTLSLEGLVLSILDSMNLYLLRKKADLAPDSRELYQILKKRYNVCP